MVEVVAIVFVGMMVLWPLIVDAGIGKELEEWDAFLGVEG